MRPFNFSHIKNPFRRKIFPQNGLFLYSNKVVYYKLCSLFAVRCSLFAVRCSLFAVRCSLFASVPKDTDFQRLMQIFKRTIHNVFLFFKSDKCRKLSYIFQIFRDFHLRYKALLAYEVYPQYEFYP